ncbi:Glycosyltransferase, GT2 family [Andreprevotia lacus DSM 23236]|jgi:glycosyltransferase involved in cell wall biosynthesis|uniref:Glycosyltransferase, GT2 family n=1 Tax=Andreprevotia lacus DSM 23236 TaxID=1121001 RepID=A0A1W1X443_9NEIS|nr:glycosyltransferase family 2 protein [Andreprevotia lacus]SMC18603.1 Glycosyltransferase, GT2 family [Andreprevotia lacus DSM 23236]
MNCVAVIPVYNHEHAIGTVVASLRTHGLPVLLVDDGSAPACAAVLDTLATQAQVSLLRLPQNQGKGGAVMAGLHEAARQGYSHALQIDADGQHDTGDVPRFLALAQQHPTALITGCPQYDASVPRVRFYGRYAAHLMVWAITLSRRITDSMCGFRVYPLAHTLPVLAQMPRTRRMDFDIEIAIRLDWQDVRIINVPTRVTYPSDGISHFNYLRDNLRITAMLIRLLGGMLWRSPMLLARHLRSGA